MWLDVITACLTVDLKCWGVGEFYQADAPCLVQSGARSWRVLDIEDGGRDVVETPEEHNSPKVPLYSVQTWSWKESFFRAEEVKGRRRVRGSDLWQQQQRQGNRKKDGFDIDFVFVFLFKDISSILALAHSQQMFTPCLITATARKPPCTWDNEAFHPEN